MLDNSFWNFLSGGWTRAKGTTKAATETRSFTQFLAPGLERAEKLAQFKSGLQNQTVSELKQTVKALSAAVNQLEGRHAPRVSETSAETKWKARYKTFEPAPQPHKSTAADQWPIRFK